MTQKTILVTAANGTVGGSLVASLLDQGFNVNALVRNTESDTAREFEKRGAKIFKGDFDDIPSLQKASQGIWGVFVNAIPVHGTLDELRHNINVINAAKEAGAKFALYMSVTMTDIKDQFPNFGPQHPNYNYWQAKYETEKALERAGFDYWTILRPGVFLNTFCGPVATFLWPTFQKQHVILSPIPPSATQSLIDPDDIARYATAAFADPDTFNGQAIDLSGEEITLKDFAKLITDITGIDIKVEHLSREEAASRGVPEVINWWNDWKTALSYSIDYDRLEQFPIQRTTSEEYVKNHKDAIINFLST
ncbi:hypothetical protein K450DRAFT_174690 [Umbelopsis ramanniana AG]|uniref:NmrA-like domain-containing protein n=1 Tax=Umbelopsis ramanniana AG TaxID=1314678 RepID=A0AAD5ECH4_UMBRA|nr:uncharacterized protein K450DRAFT_174690 [Umbelopsis ramanniana AG]KAI8579700.1 hypothetical protein K450DRAFT_174690 [Umbelopsis ramanniana AG]